MSDVRRVFRLFLPLLFSISTFGVVRREGDDAKGGVGVRGARLFRPFLTPQADQFGHHAGVPARKKSRKHHIHTHTYTHTHTHTRESIAVMRSVCCMAHRPNIGHPCTNAYEERCDTHVPVHVPMPKVVAAL